MLPRFFDTDHHLTEPPDFYTGRFSKKHADREPKFMHHPELGPGWSWDNGKSVRPMGVFSVAGEDPRKIGNFKTFEELDPGCYDPKRRVECMDVDGVRACLMFPSQVGFFHGYPDPDFYVECARVYNDAALDWAAAGDAKRIFPAAMLPMLNLEVALSELDRTAKKGYIHYMMSRWPSNEPVPSPVDDPFWASLVEHDFTVSIHGFGIGRPRTAPPAVTIASLKARGAGQLGGGRGGQEMVPAGRGRGLDVTDQMPGFIFSGVLDRFPQLKLCLVECSMGWMPYFAEAMDNYYLKHRWAAGIQIKRLPSEYLHEFYAGFDREWMGLKYRHSIGVDKITFGTDFPHIGSFYPHTRFFLELAMQGIPADEQEKILWSNAAGLYGVN